MIQKIQANKIQQNVLANHTNRKLPQLKIIQQMLSKLIQFFRYKQSQNIYNPLLAEKIIYIILKQQLKQSINFDLNAQIQKLISYLLDFKNAYQNISLINIQKCMDLLGLPQIHLIQIKFIKRWKVIVLIGLRQYYSKLDNNQKQRKKVNTCIIFHLENFLKSNEMIEDRQIKIWLIKQLIISYNLNVQELKTKKKYIQIIDQLNKVVNIIQNQTGINQKVLFQQQLMICYYNLGEFHTKLHYQLYSKKYYQLSYQIALKLEHSFISIVKEKIQSIAI